MTPQIRLTEVGPRDGLQNEAHNIPTGAKVAFVDALSHSGLQEIEVSAFVSPQWVPQLHDASDVFAAITRRDGVIYSALVPNAQGMDRALAARVEKICVFTAASDSFNKKNVNTDTAGTYRRLAPVVRCARACRLPVRGYISTAFWCPYEGYVAPQRSLRTAEALLSMGVDELSVGDTIGKATPTEVQQLLAVLLQHIPADKLVMHFHDTYGRALANVQLAYRMGITLFDASVGGLGGCPYALGAPGNVATENLVVRLRQLGAQVAVDLEGLAHARRVMATHVARLRPQSGL